MSESNSSDSVELVGADAAIALINRLQASLENPQPLMAKVANFCQWTIYQSFQQQASPTGKPWAKLAPSTIRARARKGLWNGQTLEATGEGRKSIRVILGAKNVRITYNGTMAIHQAGSDRTPQRQFAPTAENFVQGAFGDAIASLMSSEVAKITPPELPNKSDA